MNMECQRPNKFCHCCGTTLQSDFKYCPQCGQEILDSSSIGGVKSKPADAAASTSTGLSATHVAFNTKGKVKKTAKPIMKSALVDYIGFGLL